MSIHNVKEKDRQKEIHKGAYNHISLSTKLSLIWQKAIKNLINDINEFSKLSRTT